MKEIRLNIPEGCRAVTVKVDGGKVITEFEPKEEKWKPKDGDFYAIDNGSGTSSVSIYNGNYTPNYAILVPFYCGIDRYGKLRINVPNKGFGFGHYHEIRPATKEEKQRLFGALAKEGYRWNPEKKELEELPRWRAEANQNYFLVTSSLEVCVGCEVFDSIDNSRHNSCNYFRTEEAAERVAEQIREIFKDSKAE